MIRALTMIPLAILGIGCDGNVGDVDETPPLEAWEWAELELSLTGGSVIDPKLSGAPELSFDIATESELPATGCTLSVTVVEPSGRQRRLAEKVDFDANGLSLSWDGRDDAGQPFDPGPSQVSADLDCGERTKGFGAANAYVVRLGVVAVDFNGTDNISLAYHKKEVHLPGLTVLDGEIPEYVNDRLASGDAADLDDRAGTPREAPEQWLNAHFPPWRSGDAGGIGLGHHNVPAAYTAGGDLELNATFGTTATSSTGRPVAAEGPDGFSGDQPTIRAVPEGFESSEETLWTPGETVSFLKSEPLPSTLGRETLEITWRYQIEVEGAWVNIPGFHTTTHALYLLVGPSEVPDGQSIGASPAVTWIGVVEDLADAITGLPADNLEVVMDRLRETLHNDPWFVYNPGDAAYSDFEGDYIFWDDIWVEMTGWLDRDEGVDLYWHSVACVLSSQANHLGIPAHYLTLGVGFRTHLTRAAGDEDWRRWSFNSHGITELDGKVWDAAVDIDGDSNPDNLPADPVQPMGLSVDAYFKLLTADDIETVNYGRCFVY